LAVMIREIDRKNLVRKVSTRTPVPNTFAVGVPIRLSPPIPLLVGTHHRQECLIRCACAVAITLSTSPPNILSVNYKGSVRVVIYGLNGVGSIICQPTETSSTRLEEQQTAGICGYNFLPLPRRRGEAYVTWRTLT
jgi:hypothetical protein